MMEVQLFVQDENGIAFCIPFRDQAARDAFVPKSGHAIIPNPPNSGDVWENGAWVAPPQLPIEEQRKNAIARVIAYANSITAQITDSYPEAERASWFQKSFEAKAYIASSNIADAPTIAALCDAEAETTLTGSAQADAVLSKANAIVAKATYFANIVVAVEALRIKAETALNAATDDAEIEATLSALMIEANAAATSFGLSTE